MDLLPVRIIAAIASGEDRRIDSPLEPTHVRSINESVPAISGELK